MADADHLRALLDCYVTALRELRSWDDPAVDGFIARLERRLVEVDSMLGNLPLRAAGPERSELATIEPQPETP